MELFQGDAFHTSRWNYNIDLDGKRVGIIGTGATAVQVIPARPGSAEELYVFQRTPSTIDVRDQRETTEAEQIPGRTSRGGPSPAAGFAKSARAGSRSRRNDDYLAGRVPDYKERKQHERRLTARGDVEKQLDSNFRIMEQSPRWSTPSSRTRTPQRR